MSYDPVLAEIEETRRKLWAACDGTMEGYSRHCEEVAREFRARVAAEVARKKATKTWTRAGTQGDGAAEGAGALSHGAMMVCEGEAPGYGDGLQTTGAGPRSPSGMESDFARQGAEGDAE